MKNDASCRLDVPDSSGDCYVQTLSQTRFPNAEISVNCKSRNGLAEITDYSKIDDPNAALLDKQQQNKGSFFHELLRFKTHV